MSKEPTLGELITLLQTHGIDVNLHTPTNVDEKGMFICHLYNPRLKTHAKIVYKCVDEASIITALIEAETALSQEDPG